MNGHYIREAEPDRLAGLLGERLTSLGVDADPAVVREGTTLVQERSRGMRQGLERHLADLDYFGCMYGIPPMKLEKNKTTIM